jgi:hypothetical protein
MEQKNYIFRNRLFTPDELALIKSIVERHWSDGRKKIATIICEKLQWYGFNGRLKVIPCLEALRKMEKIGLLSLPPANGGGYRELKRICARDINFREPKGKIIGSVEKMGEVRFYMVNTKEENDLWRYLIQRYHYLGYRRPVGRHLKYFVYLGGSLGALISFCDGIYHHRLRDEWLGWDEKKKALFRHLVINNNRFLILPWVEVRNLGSKILSLASRIVPSDWERRYGYRPLYFETFVDADRFNGTIYRASNWKFLGKTSGMGRRGDRYFFHGKVRDYYIYELR